ncbi:MAG: aldehyde dehydrogenase family protein [Wenzhouxiangella sp.]|nr:aldehyde dehydrogenase family protein [Wenzhouxiangella sp.]MCH8478672.1 aldehyde dehydrogenase family protein [Wenzhouxiangella sp.]
MSEQLQVRNPRTGEIDYQRPTTGPDQLALMAEQARQAQTAWAALAAEHRAEALRALATVMADQREAFVQALFEDTGRLIESRLEFDAALATITRWADEAPALLAEPEPRAANIPFIQSHQFATPYPLVGVISPWNFPLLLALIDAVPALLAGAAVLVKPSEVTPRFIEVAERVQADVPALAGVLHWCVGGGDVGAALVNQVDLVCFTGSVATGRRVGEAAAARFIPAFLELGGKDAALVLDDADIDRTARALAWGSMVNAGQSCMSIERVYAVDAIHDQLVEALTREIGKLQINVDDPERGQIGPVISAAQAGILQSHLDDALEGGARALTGGRLEQRGGTWCLPTLMVDVTDQMRVMTEETFGAILPVMRVADEAEAIARANGSIYGLSAAVFSADPARAERVARQLQAGAISINDAALTSLVHSGEKQSFKQSGLGGSRMGPASIKRFLRQQCLLVNPGVDDPWWFGS